MSSNFLQQFSEALRGWWREQARENGAASAASLLLRKLWEFARDSTPERRRQRYGDMEYDWENRVNTTSGTVGWRARLLGLFSSPYQPTEQALFREMMASLPVACDPFIFVDLGSGKGRTLLIASEYPFRRIVGVESIAELHRAAEANIRAYRSPAQRCRRIETILADAREFEFPKEPLVLYLFNPLPEAGLRHVIHNLERSLEQSPRPAWIVYHNPAMDSVLTASRSLVRAGETEQYSVFKKRDL